MAYCEWDTSSELNTRYHDEEWGVPQHDDRGQFEFLMMEVMHCGLNWNMMIRKREIFRQCFDNFEYDKIAEYGEEEIERIMNTDTDDIPGLEELETARAAAEEKLRASEEKEKALEDSIRTLSGSAEEKAEKEAALRTAEEALQEKETHRRLLEKTGAYLSAAREAQNDRYMEPLLTGFRYYYGLLSGLSAEQYSIDENAGVKLMELGEEREAGSLSTAYRDLIGLSLRLSLVDAMYTGEKPFLVMDDPFVNFDLKKTGEGKKFLEKVAEKYQIIYFTCHESRA